MTSRIYQFIQMLPVVQLLNSFTFATIPLRQGMLNIHTPERLYQIQQGVRMPYFQIRNTSAPHRFGPFAMVTINCLIHGHPQTLKMYTDKQKESNILCVGQNEKTTALLRFRVGAYSHSDCGHSMAMTTQCYRTPRLTERTLTPLVFFFLFMEGSLKHKIPFREDKNLALYRAMVLQME